MEMVRQWGVIICLGLVGMGLVGYGVWDQVKPREVKVEIIKEKGESEKVKVNGEVVVDVAGAVEKPGVYKLPSNSRIGDALVLAGGLSANADRSWVSATLNLAEKLEDGEKIFIPRRDENSNIGSSNIVISERQRDGRININTASISELDSLEGIGAARAQAIIENRPYSKIEELVAKAKIPQSVYEKISTSISVY